MPDTTQKESITGTAFLIGQLFITNAGGSGGTFTLDQNTDLRGQIPSTVAGGTASFVTEFSDNTFRIQDNGDVTKQLAFEASGITTATRRTLTVPNVSGIMAVDEMTDDFTFNGSVGIGASTPSGKLHIEGVSDATALIKNTGNKTMNCCRKVISPK